MFFLSTQILLKPINITLFSAEQNKEAEGKPEGSASEGVEDGTRESGDCPKQAGGKSTAKPSGAAVPSRVQPKRVQF